MAFYYNGSIATVRNNTIAGGEYGIYVEDGTAPTVSNCIIWDNSIDDLSNCTATYSCIQDGDSGTGNISSDPCFVDADANNFHIKSTSPCIDVGDPNTTGTNEFDIDGETRVADGNGDTNSIVDMGADEVMLVHNITKDKWYATIQSAIDDANTGNVIELSQGTYKENIDFNGKLITVRGTDPNDWDVVESTKVIANSSAYAVFYMTSGEDLNTILTGVTISGGTSGIMCDNNSTPLITKCIIEKNGLFGGIALDSGCAAIISNNFIRNNRKYGVYCLSNAATITNNFIYGNGVGLRLVYSNPSVDINNNTVFGCKDHGISVQSGTSPTVTNCIIWSTSDDLSSASATYSCIEDGDSGTGNISSDPCLTNVFDFADRTNGAGTTTTIKVADASLYEVNDVIEYDNDGVARTVTDVNAATDIVSFADDTLEANSVTNIMIYNWGPGVTDVNEDLHIKNTSLCINAGDPNSSYTGQTDIDGESRVINQRVEIGADEITMFIYNMNKDKWYATIQSAIDDANDGNVIELSPGTYNEYIDFKGKAIKISGTDPNDWDVVESTIIDGNEVWTVSITSGEDANTILEGLTIRDGSSGGVICDNNSSPVISKCVLEKNGSFGAISWDPNCSPIVTNNIIRNNRGYAFYSMSNSAIVKNNLIYGNYYGWRLFYCSPDVIISNNTIFGCKNQGIVRISSNSTEPTITNCIIWSTSDDLVNCSATYSCIEDGDSGTGNISSDPCFVNVFDFADRTNGAGTKTTIKVADASLYEVNDVIEYDNDGIARTVTDVNTTSDIVTFTNALDTNSASMKMIYNWGLGVTDVNEDLHIKDTSPCLDAGDPNTTGSNELDIDGQPRVVDGDGDSNSVIDMGVDEFPQACQTCIGDLSGNGWITASDISFLVGLLNQEGPPYLISRSNPLFKDCGDIDRDGWLTETDVSLLSDMLNEAGSPYRIQCQ